MRMERVLLLANGDWGAREFAIRLAQQASFVIAADGAWDQAVALGIPVDEVVGDFDSSLLDPSDTASNVPAIHRFPTDKDWTDLELALEHALRRTPDELVVYGAFGGRLDHALANVSLLERALLHGIPMQMLTPTESLRLVDSDLMISDATLGDTVSLIPHSGEACLTTEGLQYPLSSECLKRGTTRGVSNVIRELPAWIRVHSGRVLVIHGSQGDLDA